LCLGKSVALLESAMLLGMLIKQFHFDCVSTNVTYALTITLPIKDGLRVKVTERTIEGV
jgi:cytochrome P450